MFITNVQYVVFIADYQLGNALDLPLYIKSDQFMNSSYLEELIYLIMIIYVF